MTLYFDEDVRPDDQTAATMEAAAIAALEGEGIDPSQVSISVSFVDKKEIRSLNAQYRNMDKETDVLSFPAFDPGQIPAPEDLEEDEELAIGDVVILHLLGYDHETEDDKQDMRAREEEVMKLLGIER